MLVIKAENSSKERPARHDGVLFSTKQDGGLHGWGVKSVRAAAEKYDGVVETDYEENRFRTVVTLFYDGVKTEE